MPVSDVLTESVLSTLQKSLREKMPTREVAERAFAWLKPKLPVTLKLNVEATQAAAGRRRQGRQDADAKSIPSAESWLTRKDDNGTAAPIDEATLGILQLEHQTELDARPFSSKLSRSLAVFGMYVALYVLCGFYIWLREPRIINELSRLATLLALVVVTVTLMIITYDWRAELIPLMLFGMTIAIAYQQELALLLSAAITLMSVVALGHELADAIVLMATTAGAILLLGRVRSRSKLLTVGFVAAGVAMLTTLGVGTLEGEPIDVTFWNALLWGLWAIIAGSLMTCLLPFVERMFQRADRHEPDRAGRPGPSAAAGARPPRAGHVQPLDHRRLARRIGRRSDRRPRPAGARRGVFPRHRQDAQAGLLRRKPGPGRQPPRSLVPAMSTLVIIAHVKDGADLARQNKIPEPIIDFIQQHHGTTLVEYFYRQASESKKSDPNGARSTKARSAIPARSRKPRKPAS